ncbi:hypothetical protein K466DRAFT_101736 [Polyporus arcularius HHB13444]|uniref:Uncharacterized protein n=1 Tax=Polyporus arcularius HHB13444 TaxID=1314778 RepID=A0A5C3PFS5_9APHY|nr:hypothetical protein K466DRAFT_101736 [Polyporus arcularius HHB13444]
MLALAGRLPMTIRSCPERRPRCIRPMKIWRQRLNAVPIQGGLCVQDLPGPARLLRAPAGMCYCATRRLPPPPSGYGRSVARSTLSKEKRVVYAADGPQATTGIMSSWPRPCSTPFDLPLARASTCSVGVLAPRRDLTIHLRSLPVRRNSVRQHLISRQPPSDSGPVQADCRSQLSQGRAVGALYMNEDVAS